MWRFVRGGVISYHPSVITLCSTAVHILVSVIETEVVIDRRENAALQSSTNGTYHIYVYETRQIYLVEGVPFVSEVFFFRESF